jgi:3-phosphoshikimate 1-carboxyvinyltransferase
MKILVKKGKLDGKINGKIKIPGSKSHTIRALILAGLGEGQSEIREALFSEDTKSCMHVIKAMGAKIEEEEGVLRVDGFGKNPIVPEDVIHVGNSGTTMNIALGVASTIPGMSVFTGDYQIRKRPILNLMKSLNDLGAKCWATRNNGCPPVVVQGRLQGGETTIDAITSQYLTSLLMAAPLADQETKIHVPVLYEAPYVEMTLWWLRKQGIQMTEKGLNEFEIQGGQSYKSFSEKIPGDFSSATFFMVLAAISGGEILLENLDMTDPQGDKEVLHILKAMGAKVDFLEEGIKITGKDLTGIEVDMNAIPDAIPAMAVLGCFAKGETRLLNAPQARLKETDRIKVMCQELRKMGADIEELPDGLIVRESQLKACFVNGHDDHRVVMALAIAGLNLPGETIVDTAEAIHVTFPEFIKLANACGGEIVVDEEGSFSSLRT